MNNVDIIFPKKGYARATEIACIPPPDTKFTSADVVIWYFGDGEKEIKTKNNTLSTTHTYLLKGDYNISAVAYLSAAEGYTSETYVISNSCSIVNYIDYSVTFLTIPPPTIPGYYTQFPYKIIFTTPDINAEPIIDLYAQFSRSYPPQEPRNKWSFLRPEWRFVDLSGNDIKSLKPAYNSVKINNRGEIDADGVSVGLTGVAEFYFVDDLYNIDTFIKNASTPIIWASMPTSAINYYKDSESKSGSVFSYSTTDIRAYAPYTAYFKTPDYLTITENKIQDLNSTKWAGAIVPFFISSHIDISNLNVTPYNPEYNFVKYLPYALSAQGNTYVPCAQDLKINVSLITPASATFDNPSSIASQGEYYFTQTDEYGYTAPGFTRGTVTLHQEDTTRLYAETTINYNELNLPNAPVFAPYLWIPNPSAGTLSIIYYTGVLNAQFIEALKNQYSTNFTSNIFTPVVTNANTPSDNIHGYNGMYAVASVPGTEPTFNYYAWVADADLDCIYKYNPNGSITQTISLSSVFLTTNIKYTPTSLSVDSDKNLWVSCYDNGFIYKFDENGNFLLSIDSSTLFSQSDPGIDGVFSADRSNIFEDGQIIQPTCIETDKNSNLWVTYSNILSGRIVKYDSLGNIIIDIIPPIQSTPQSIVVDSRDDSVWVALTHEADNKNSQLVKYSSAGVLTFSETIENLTYMTIDVNYNLWFIYNYNKIGRVLVDATTSDNVVFTVKSKDPLIDIPLPSSSPFTIEHSILEGIGCSDKNLLFIIHSAQNSVYVFDPVSERYIDNIKIRPHQNKGIYNDINSDTSLYRERNNSIAVIGDWTGFKWGQKFHSYNFGTKTISGLSNELKFLSCNLPDVRKYNQDFNMAAQLSSIALAPPLSNNYNLFNKFFKSIYGTSRNKDDIGTTLYEKIANFLSNTKDIDTCEIDSLYDIADMLDVVIEDYRLAYPAQLKHLMNLLSITHRKLWGIRCKCNTNFAGTSNCTLTDICKICGKCKELNRGKRLEYNHVEEGVPVVIYDRKYNSYFLHYPASIDNLTTYSVDMLTAIGLTAPIADNYYFYDYVPTAVSSYTEGVIDWKNPYTTLNETLSTYNDWTRENGTIDELLSLELYRGLNLIPFEPICTALPTPTPTPTTSNTLTPTPTQSLTPTIASTSTQTPTPTQTPTQTVPETVENGYVFFADVNWLYNVNNATNRKSCYELFRIFFKDIKNIQCNRYINNHKDSKFLFGVNYPGAKTDKPDLLTLDVLHAALDPQGYTFSPVDITVPNAHLLVDSPFFMSFHAADELAIIDNIYTPTVIENLQNIAKSYPVIIVGEWRIYREYDNYIIQKVTNHASWELFASGDLSTADSVPNSAHKLGKKLIDSGVTMFDHDATSYFTGTCAEEYAFAKAAGKPSMLVIPFREPPPKPSQTATATNTPTPTITNSNTQTPTITNTNTQTPTITQTITNTNTETPTLTPTVTVTHTPTRTSTPTISLTQTLTPTPSVTKPPIADRVTIGVQIIDNANNTTNEQLAFGVARGSFIRWPLASSLTAGDGIIQRSTTFTGSTRTESAMFIMTHNGVDVSGYTRSNAPAAGERFVQSMSTPSGAAGGRWGTYTLFLGRVSGTATPGVSVRVFLYEVDHSSRQLTVVQTTNLPVMVCTSCNQQADILSP